MYDDRTHSATIWKIKIGFRTYLICIILITSSVMSFDHCGTNQYPFITRSMYNYLRCASKGTKFDCPIAMITHGRSEQSVMNAKLLTEPIHFQNHTDSYFPIHVPIILHLYIVKKKPTFIMK